jgi:acetyl coenzyme A synthetase (ADP forming)-like protein
MTLANLDPVFRPRSIAVIGASTEKGSIGWYLVHNIVGGDFNGNLFPVNLRAETIHSIKCYGRVTDIPDPVDLAVICVPKRFVLEVVEQCGRKGVKALVVITAGFKEIEGEGIELEAKLLEAVRRHGMVLVGPNCMGVINTDPGVRLNATFAPEGPDAGAIGFMSQSGALGVAIITIARQLGLGLSVFISLGNKTDVNANDVLEYLERDERTRIIAMYLESVGNPRIFKELARRVTRRKPIVLVKAGRTEAGAIAASSHTGALAGPDQAVTALTEQAGVVRVTSMEDLFDVLQALRGCPLPRGPHVAVLTNAGGPAIMATDAIIGMGLEMARLAPETVEALGAFLPPEASLKNPVDMIAGAQAADYGRALECLGRDPGVDAIMAIFVPPLMIDPVDVATAIRDQSRRIDKPVVSVILAALEWHSSIRDRIPDLPPIYLFPEAAAKALHALSAYAARRNRPEGKILAVDVDVAAVDTLLDPAQADAEGFIAPDRVMEVLARYGIPVARWAYVTGEREAIKAACKTGYPVVAKLGGKGIVHKTEIKGVRLDLKDEIELISALREMRADLERFDPDAELSGFLIQEMVTGEREVFMGVREDPSYGDLVVFGMGGKYVEVLQDTFMRLAPITDLDARTMIEGIRGYPLLEGVRGEPSSRIDLLKESLQRLSALITNHPLVMEMDVNPFMAGSTAETCKVVDARIRVRKD